jgi:hypothetical protein
VTWRRCSSCRQERGGSPGKGTGGGLRWAVGCTSQRAIAMRSGARGQARWCCFILVWPHEASFGPTQLIDAPSETILDVCRNVFRPPVWAASSTRGSRPARFSHRSVSWTSPPPLMYW